MAQTNPHQNLELLRAFGLGMVDRRDGETIAGHLETCVECRRVVATAPADAFLKQLQAAAATAGEADANTNPESSRPLEEAGPLEAAPIRPSAAVPEAIPAALASSPDYEVIREISRGGMGVVYLARNRRMDRLEGLKVVKSALLERAGALERFEREMRAAARLAHPNIVTAYSSPPLEGLLAFAMEYVDGTDLHQLVRTRGALPVSNACYYVYQAAQGLQHACDRKMVHRDIKPNNLMLTRDGKKQVIKILDFGLAKATSENPIDAGLTGEGQMLGTPSYMAPEQIISAATADIRADIYSLGCTLHYLLTGEAPFKGKGSLYEILEAHRSETARPLNELRPDVPAEVAGIVARMLHKDPAQRYQQPAEVAQALMPYFKQGVKPIPTGNNRFAVPPVAQAPPETASSKAAEATRMPAPVPSGPAPANPAPSIPPGADADDVNPLQTMLELVTEPAPSRTSGQKGSRGPHRTPSKGVPPKLWIGVAAGILLLGGLGMWTAGVITVKTMTREGTLVVEVNVPDAEVFVDGEKVKVTWSGGRKKATVSVESGTKNIEVKKEGFIAVGETLTFKEGKETVFAARLEPNQRKEPKPAPKPEKAADEGEQVPSAQISFGGEKPGQVRDDNGLKMKLVWCPAGTFLMGSPDSDSSAEEQEKPQVRVTLTQGYWLGKYEVTQGEWEQVMATRPWAKKPNGREESRKSATEVTWDDAISFCRKLTEQERQAGRLPDDWEWTLPTEAQWEYACRAGTITRYTFGDDATRLGEYAWYVANTQDGEEPFAHRVGQLPGNPWGLHDMHGNVWEWCRDWASDELAGGTDPVGRRLGMERNCRGGSWTNPAKSCRSAYRYKFDPSFRNNDLGFRVALIPLRDSARETKSAPPGGAPNPWEMVPFFNGKDLTGWKGLTGYWQVRDAAIVGAPANGVKQHTFLCSERKYGDFELKFRVRRKNGIGNSGVVFRGQLADAQRYTVTGPKVEIAAPDFTPPGSVVSEPWAAPALWANRSVVAKAWKNEDFNEMHIRCVGKHVIVKVNGVPVVDAPYPKMEGEGIIAWQLHGGTSPEEVIFKDIDFKDLTRATDTGPNAALPAAGNPLKPAADSGQPAWPADATVFGSKRLKLFNEHLNWHAARKKCGELGGRLAEVRSQAENDFLVKLVAGTGIDGLWLGASDEVEEGRWVWSDGSPLSFTSWEKNQPNNAGPGGEHYLMLMISKWRGKWWDQPTTSGLGLPAGWKVGYVCEWDVDGKTGTTPSAEDNDGFKPLFNGKNLNGWEQHPNQKGNWQVENGVLRGPTSGVAHLYTTRQDFSDFHLRLRARINDRGFGGIWLRSDFGPRGGSDAWARVPHGYKAHINSTAENPSLTGTRTGTLSVGPGGRKADLPAGPPVPRPGEWFDMELIAQGDHLVAKLNGIVTVDCVDEDRLFLKGRLALQDASDRQQTVIEFSKIEIKELSPQPVAGETAKPGAPDAARELRSLEQLEKAKAAYAAELRHVRDAVLESFRKREEAARKGGNKKQLDQIVAERTAFEDLQEMPRSPAPPSRRKLATAHAAVESAYLAAIKEYTKLGRDADAQRIQKEAEDFSETADLASTWTPLFNGKNLMGWTPVQVDKSNWSVQDGVIVGTGGHGYLYSDRANFTNYRLRLEAMISDPGNSGVFLRSPTGNGVPAGYEPNIDAAARQTGMIFVATRVKGKPDLKVAANPLPETQKANEWFLMDIVMRGDTIVVKVNGRQVNRFKDADRTFTSGYIVLQILSGTVRFRRVEINELNSKI